ncbi:F-box-like domain-containing protein [Ceratobasidium sp. AG-Ba]|nr:F-box-like domain-containing protein [Ceratobasidium sp. AG-Ba]QRW10879.1 F-box-like domain-containing protein [Ceratobasidium sp. AG-Ba]
MNTPDLWTHIDIQPEIPSNITELLFQLTKNLPITVHFCDGPGRKYVAGQAVGREQEFVTAMTPHIDRIDHLDLESYRYGEEGLVLTLLKLWFDRGSPSSAKSLMVYRHYRSQEGDEEYDTVMRHISENAEGMLRAVHILHLRAADIGWETGAFDGLTDFRFDASNHADLGTISTSEIFNVLLACPALAILKLRSIEITRVHGWNPATPVKLGCLKILNLTGIFGIQYFLPIIDLPKDSPNLSVGLPTDSFLHDQVLSFVVPCQMEVLRLAYDDDYPASEKASLFTSFPFLSTLVLAPAGWLRSPLAVTDLTSCPQGQSTTLETVILVGENVSLSYLEILVDKYQFKNIHLEGCYVSEDYPLCLEDTADSLVKRRPGVQCYVSSIDATKHLSEKVIFEHESYM